MMYGYTMEELYGNWYELWLGRSVGMKHSAEVAREISKDSLLIVLFLLGNMYFVWEYRK